MLEYVHPKIKNVDLLFLCIKKLSHLLFCNRLERSTALPGSLCFTAVLNLFGVYVGIYFPLFPSLSLTQRWFQDANPKLTACPAVPFAVGLSAPWVVDLPELHTVTVQTEKGIRRLLAVWVVAVLTQR